jgi:hypothetical protein
MRVGPSPQEPTSGDRRKTHQLASCPGEAVSSSSPEFGGFGEGPVRTRQEGSPAGLVDARKSVEQVVCSAAVLPAGDPTIGLLAGDATGSNCASDRRRHIDDTVEHIQAPPHRQLLDTIDHVAPGVLNETPQRTADVWVSGTRDPSRWFIAEIARTVKELQSGSNAVISAWASRSLSEDAPDRRFRARP